MGFPIKYLPIIAKLLHLLNLQRLAYGRRKNEMPIWRREELIDLFGLELDQGTFDTTKLLNPKTSKKLYFTEEELSQAIEIEQHQDLRLLFNLDRSEQGDLLHNTLTLLTHLQEKFYDDATIKMALTVVEELLLEIKGSLDRFVTAHEAARNQLTLPLLHDLIHTTISQARIPFSGEPLGHWVVAQVAFSRPFRCTPNPQTSLRNLGASCPSGSQSQSIGSSSLADLALARHWRAAIKAPPTHLVFRAGCYQLDTPSKGD